MRRKHSAPSTLANRRPRRIPLPFAIRAWHRRACKNITSSTCSRTHPGPACMWGIRKVTRLRTSSRGSSACADDTYCIRWAGMRLACRLSSTQSRRGSTRGRPPRKTLVILSGRLRALDSATIGAVRRIQPNRVTSNGANGFFCSCTTRGSTPPLIRRSRLKRLSIPPMSPPMMPSANIEMITGSRLFPMRR